MLNYCGWAALLIPTVRHSGNARLLLLKGRGDWTSHKGSTGTPFTAVSLFSLSYCLFLTSPSSFLSIHIPNRAMPPPIPNLSVFWVLWPVAVGPGGWWVLWVQLAYHCLVPDTMATQYGRSPSWPCLQRACYVAGGTVWPLALLAKYLWSCPIQGVGLYFVLTVEGRDPATELWAKVSCHFQARTSSHWGKISKTLSHLWREDQLPQEVSSFSSMSLWRTTLSRTHPLTTTPHHRTHRTFNMSKK